MTDSAYEEHGAPPPPGAARLKADDAATYDDVAGDFDVLTGRYTEPIAEKAIRRAGIGAGQRVLDVGCGTGVMTFLAARAAGPAGQVVGLDLSAGMLRQAATRARESPWRERVGFVRGDAERIPFRDASFHAVVSLYALRHLPDPEAALREMFRCSLPGAPALVAVGSAPPLFSRGFVAGALRVGRDRMLALAGRPALAAPAFLDRLIERRLGASEQTEEVAWTGGKAHHSDPVAAMMKRVGYRHVRSQWIGHAAVIPTPQEFWTLQVTFSTYARKRIQRAPPGEVADLRSTFDALCTRHLARGGRLFYRSGALVVTATRPEFPGNRHRND